jgi:hypothetical protein
VEVIILYSEMHQRGICAELQITARIMPSLRDLTKPSVPWNSVLGECCYGCIDKSWRKMIVLALLGTSPCKKIILCSVFQLADDKWSSRHNSLSMLSNQLLSANWSSFSCFEFRHDYSLDLLSYRHVFNDCIFGNWWSLSIWQKCSW